MYMLSCNTCQYAVLMWFQFCNSKIFPAKPCCRCCNSYVFPAKSCCCLCGRSGMNSAVQSSRVKGRQNCAQQQKLLTQIYQVKMSRREEKDCSYLNSDYCLYTKKENGRKIFHPIIECKNQGSKKKNVPTDIQKKCKFDEECRFGTSCFYSHVKKSLVNEDQMTYWSLHMCSFTDIFELTINKLRMLTDLFFHFYIFFLIWDFLS